MPHTLKLPTSYLKGKKNLLAFSAGIDSSALFFLLLEEEIAFDIAIVDYGLRQESQQEVAHAKALARKHKRFCHHIKAPHFPTHFEEKARQFRYEFFESLILIEGYDTLLTAHQLNDQLEWFLMRLSKGAGVSELLGIEPMSKKEHYTLLRPLLSYPKEALLAYLQHHHHPYFEDESNLNTDFERNHFRHHFSNALLQAYPEGIARSFKYLRKDKALIESGYTTLYQKDAFVLIELTSPSLKAKAVDMTLKKLGYLLSASQRTLIQESQSVVIGGVWVVEQYEQFLYISPYHQTPMPKAFKEACRVAHIPPKVRPYLYEKSIHPSQLPHLKEEDR